jgi:ATP-dependent Clp protease ATP-binding subunit ClpA
MFERFTPPARSVVVLAQEEARELRHGYIGTEHLLLGLLREGSGPGPRALARLGIAHDDVRADVLRIVGTPDDRDEELLETLGIDLDEIRRRVEDTFGPGALDRARRRRGKGRCEDSALPGGRIPFTPRAKKVLELSVREAERLHHGYIGTEHILLGLSREGQGLAAKVLEARGAPGEAVRAAVDQELGSNGKDG